MCLWEPEPETSLITNLHWRVSCPLPEGKRSPRLTKHREPFAERCQASGDAALVCPFSRRQEGGKPAYNGGEFGHFWDFKIHPKSLGKLKALTCYRTGPPWGCCPPKEERGLPSHLFSTAETVLGGFGLCQGAFALWSLVRSLCPSSLHLPLLQISSPAAHPSQILLRFAEDPESVAEVRPRSLDQRDIMDLKISRNSL